MKPLINLLINDHLEGDNFPLMGMFHYLLVEREIPLLRIIEVAENSFGIPRNVVLATLDTMFERGLDEKQV